MGKTLKPSSRLEMRQGRSGKLGKMGKRGIIDGRQSRFVATFARTWGGFEGYATFWRT